MLEIKLQHVASGFPPSSVAVKILVGLGIKTRQSNPKIRVGLGIKTRQSNPKILVGPRPGSS